MPGRLDRALNHEALAAMSDPFPRQCQPFADNVSALSAQIDALQEQLSSASPQDKPRILALIAAKSRLALSSVPLLPLARASLSGLLVRAAMAGDAVHPRPAGGANSASDRLQAGGPSFSGPAMGRDAELAISKTGRSARAGLNAAVGVGPEQAVAATIVPRNGQLQSIVALLEQPVMEKILGHLGLRAPGQHRACLRVVRRRKRPDHPKLSAFRRLAAHGRRDRLRSGFRRPRPSG